MLLGIVGKKSQVSKRVENDGEAWRLSVVTG